MLDHLRIAHRVFKCVAHCQKTFRDNHDLKRHQFNMNCLKVAARLAVSGAIVCNYCAASFTSEHRLSEHHRRGTCPKRYQCQDCDFKPYFSKLGDLKIHKDVVHSPDVPSRAPLADLVSLKISDNVTSFTVRVPKDCLVPGTVSQQKLNQVLSENIKPGGPNNNILSPQLTKNALQAQLMKVLKY